MLPVGVALALLAYSLVCLWHFSVLVLAVVALWFGHIPGFRRCVASGISMRCRRAPLHVLGILLSSAFLVSLVYRVFCWAFLSLPSLPVVSVFLCFGVRVRVCAMSYLLFFH